jgi:purine nucleoside permease
MRITTLLCLFLGLTAFGAAEPIRPKVIVIATFEIGADTGDKPGEFQYWAEREHLDGSIAVPGLDHPVRFNSDGLYGVVSGTTGRAGLQLMALALDPRFDLSHTYWVVTGIAGVNPHVATVGSVAWARHVIDGDVAYELDPREAPEAWPYGIMALGNKTPLKPAVIPDWAPKPMSYTLNPGLVDWAYGLTKDVALANSPAAEAHRALFASLSSAAGQPPRVFVGDSFGSSRYWHGEAMQHWAEDWTKLYAGPDALCAMSNMEDQGLAAALWRLDKMSKVDFSRVLFLRSGSNFTLPAPRQASAESMVADYAGGPDALDALHRAGSVVVHKLLREWETYAAQTPGQK